MSKSGQGRNEFEGGVARGAGRKFGETSRLAHAIVGPGMGIIRHLASHAASSAKGWLVFARSSPYLATTLLVKRVLYTLTRRMIGTWTDPQGYVVDGPLVLVSYWSIFVEGELSHPSWMESLKSIPAPRVIDVGANAGVFVHYVHTLNPKSVILAVEPQPALAKRISDYGSARRADLRVVAVACADRAGKAPLYFTEDGDSNASLSVNFAVAHSRSVSVPLVTLDEIALDGDICLLKVDAEGHDLDVLRGAACALKRTRHLLIELHRKSDVAEVERLLGAHWQPIQVGPADYLFSNSVFAAPQGA